MILVGCGAVCVCVCVCVCEYSVLVLVGGGSMDRESFLGVQTVRGVVDILSALKSIVVHIYTYAL